ncbi:MAG: hypothetical protein K0S68_936 [Candidatus Saccharibacteria bacterium]|nr:hypothetical protein [Candidatus Saccharibacteria bacterium]
MTKLEKYGYITGGVLGVVVLAAYGAVVYIVSTPGSPGHCEAMLRLFGTTDCSLAAAADASGFGYVALIAIVLTLAGGGIGSLLSRSRRPQE